MISSTSSSDPTLRVGQAVTNGQAPARPRAARPADDQVSTEGAAKLATELARQPEIRPEVVERAQALAADPNYPSPEIMRRVGEMILGSPDLSEDES
jgi:hypothetical protein